jgi:hypothetical protein
MASSELQLHFSKIAWRSEVGLNREGNEDSGFVSPNVLAVADGMPEVKSLLAP